MPESQNRFDMYDQLGRQADAGPLVNTFSIVGYDPEIPAWGIGISSRFLAVGARTCFGSAEGGVVVIQAHFNALNGTGGLELLEGGIGAQETVDRLMAKDEYRDLRQMAVIDRQGSVVTYTGKKCGYWAGGFVGEHCAAQGNMLLGGEGMEAMVKQFADQKGSLARRLVDAMTLGDEIAGDARGRQAAALYVVRPNPDVRYDVFNEPIIDLRVDDHSNPFQELSRLLDLHELLHEATADDEWVPADTANVQRLQKVLASRGYHTGAISGVLDDDTGEALKKLAFYESFKKRQPQAGGDRIDGRLLAWLEANPKQ